MKLDIYIAYYNSSCFNQKYFSIFNKENI